MHLIHHKQWGLVIPICVVSVLLLLLLHVSENRGGANIGSSRNSEDQIQLITIVYIAHRELATQFASCCLLVSFICLTMRVGRSKPITLLKQIY